MCGIIGHNLVSHKEDAYLHIADYRGPDHTAVVRAGDFTLGHNRLSIIDLSEAAHQPFRSDCGNYIIVYNGEVYNYKEIRKKLEKKYRFRTSSDTEVVLYNYIEKKEKCLDDFIGMFAFAVYDIRNNRLFGARDRMGIKPLVYHYSSSNFAFASEIKVVKLLLGHYSINQSAIDQYLRYLYIPSPNTMYQEINKLEPGHYFYYQDNELKISKYWDANDYIGQNDQLGEDEILERLDYLMDDAVRLRMIADVELGSFLSGGIDSSAILYYMVKNSNQPVNTFTIGFKNAQKYDESEDAKFMAEYFNTNHREITIFPDVVELLPKIVHHFDQPFGNPTSILIYELTKETKKNATVALAGDGGDEIFGGYPRYEAALLYNKVKSIPRVIWKILNPIVATLPESATGDHRLRRIKTFLHSLTKPADEMYEDWVGYFSLKEINQLRGAEREFDRVVRDFYKMIPTTDLLIKTSLTDIKTYLVENLLTYGDSMSMANSFEVRTPLIDHRLVEFMTSIPSGYRIRGSEKKFLIKKLLKGRIPDKIINKPKLGLNPPMGLWLKKDLRDLVHDYLSESSMESRGLNYELVSRIVQEHYTGKKDRSMNLWGLIVLEEWFRQQDSNG